MKFKYLCAFILSITCLATVRASDLQRIDVLTNRILVLYFTDGYIEHSGYRQHQSVTKAFKSPLDIQKAMAKSSYGIKSTNDTNYSIPLEPEVIGRKTKGMDWSNNCNWVNSVCDNDYINEHFIYLKLPHALTDGHIYTISLEGLAENLASIDLDYHYQTSRSVAIHANQIGYLPDAPVKLVYLSHWMGDGGPLPLDGLEGADFHLFDQLSGEKVYSGKINSRLKLAENPPLDLQRYPNQGYLSMSDVWECDFSEFRRVGDYVLAVKGVGTSFPFRIAGDVYREAYYHTTRQLYHQRSGIALEKQHTEWTRPRNLHPADGRIKFQYTTSRWNEWPSNAAENGQRTEVYSKVLPDYKLETWGWYMDAGDWDGYYNHLKIPRLLMTAFELAPDNFADGELNIPESGNGIPDILDEARWLIDYLDRTRGPSGGVAGARIHPDFEQKAVDNIPSWEDERIWTISGEDHITTYTFAGMAAHLAFLYRKIGLDSLATPLEAKALEAYLWAAANSNPTINDSHNARLYAAASMYKLTGEEKYQNDFAFDFVRNTNARYALDNQHFAWWMYLTTHREDIRADLRSSCLSQAAQYVQNEFVTTAAQRSFRVGFGVNFRTFLGQATTPLIFPALVMYHVTGEQRYYEAAITSCDYVLGANPLDMTWVTGMGHRSPRQLLHLDTWLHPDGRQQFIPGTIPYGPTAPGEGWPPNNGPWSSDFAWNRIYPSRDQWPLHEGFFDNRYCVPTNEYTVHQTSAPAAAVYGFLAGQSKGVFTPNKPPTAILTIDGEQVSGSAVLLKANATDEDGYVYKVEFYNGHQIIGTSYKQPFSFLWQNIPEGAVSLSVVATDNKGLRSDGFVSLQKSIETITPSKTTLNLVVGDIEKLTASFHPLDAIVANLVWESANSAIASVNQLGEVRALSEGTTVITVRALDGDANASVSVNVKALVAGDNTLESKFFVFPNPIDSGWLMIRTPVDMIGAATYKITEMNGKEIAKGEIHISDNPPHLDIRQLKQGLYLIHLSNEIKQVSTKFLIE